MPECGSQVILCNLPVRFDTYQGCSHGCKYCFVYRKSDISKIKKHETAAALKKFVQGYRNIETNWCDWNIPLHWGGVSDPFQPAELKYKNTLECLKVFAESKYPFVVSTKSTLPTKEPYYSLLKECNFVFQASMLSPAYDKLEAGAPPFLERLRMLEKMSSAARRVIVRLQPYIMDYHQSIVKYFPDYSMAGVHGVVAEAIKFQRKMNGMIKLQGDFVYPVATLKPKFQHMKTVAHKHGLKFYSGENRLRTMGDSLTCCGTDDLPGFRANMANLNQYLFDREKFKYTKAQQGSNTAYCFKSLCQNTKWSRVLQKSTFSDIMNVIVKDKSKAEILISP